MLLYALIYIYICNLPFIYFVEIIKFVRFEVKVKVVSKIQGV
jgi:hypothetical protein